MSLSLYFHASYDRYTRHVNPHRSSSVTSLFATSVPSGFTIHSGAASIGSILFSVRNALNAGCRSRFIRAHVCSVGILASRRRKTSSVSSTKNILYVFTQILHSNPFLQSYDGVPFAETSCCIVLQTHSIPKHKLSVYRLRKTGDGDIPSTPSVHVGFT